LTGAVVGFIGENSKISFVFVGIILIAGSLILFKKNLIEKK